jgi:hypothetical protein
LSEKQAKLSGSKLKWWNLLHQDTETRLFCNHQTELKEFFSQENQLVFCNDICPVTEAYVHQHNPPDWHLSTL